MPNKHNAKRRHHIPKMKYSVRNWREYDAARRARGSLRSAVEEYLNDNVITS